MENIISYCGINCANCPTYLATQKEDDELRRQVQKNYKNNFKMDIKLEDVNCDGCNSDEKVFFFCSTCRVRKCAREKNYENCAYCEEYICRKLNGLYKVLPPDYKAKETLEEIIKSI